MYVYIHLENAMPFLINIIHCKFPIYNDTHRHTHIYIYIDTYIHAYVHAYMHTYIHVYTLFLQKCVAFL